MNPRNTVSSSNGASTTVVRNSDNAPPGPASNAFSIVELDAVPLSSPLSPVA